MISRSTTPLRSCLALVFAACSAIGCGELAQVSAGVCGNGVKEPGEDCDTFASSGKACNSACHFECDPSGNPGCPDGAACGLDGICHFYASCADHSCKYLNQKKCNSADLGCRLTQSTYVPLGQMLPVPAQNVRLADFNGDGRNELLTLGSANQLWQSYPRVEFFDDAGKVKEIFDPRIPISSPSIVTLNPLQGSAKQRHQIVFTSGFGIGTFDIAADDSVLPLAYPTQQMPLSGTYRMALVKGTTQKPYGESVILCMNSSASPTGMGVINVANEMKTLALMPQPLANLLGEPQTANVDQAHSPCDEVLLAFSGDSNVYMLNPCDASGALAMTQEPGALPPSIVTLASGNTLGKSPLVGTIDRDSRTLDLLLADAQGTVYAAFGDGKGNFFADPNNPAATAKSAWPVSVEKGEDCRLEGPVSGSFPLALADINGDGVADWISPSGVQLTESVTIDPSNGKVTLKACTVKTPFIGTWSIAKVADFNADGFLDIVAGSFNEQNLATQSPDLDFLEGTGMGLLNASGILAAGPPKHIVVGDFDGDNISDIAFTETALSSTSKAGANSPSTTDKLAIAFGNPSGPPSAPVEIGQFSSVKQILSGKYAGEDAIDELGVIAEPNDASGQQLSVFIGSSGRHLFAPLGLASFVLDGTGSLDEVAQIPLASVAGSVPIGSEPRRSLISVAMDCDDKRCYWRVWLVPGNAAGGFDAPIASPLLPDDFAPYKQKALNSLEAGNQGEVAVALAIRDPDEAKPSSAAYALASGQDDGKTILWRINLPTNGQWPNPFVERVATLIKGQVSAISKPVLADLNDDGFEDLAVILTDMYAHQRLCILWNDRAHDKPQGPEVCADQFAAVTDVEALKHTGGFALRKLDPSVAQATGVTAGLVAVTDAGTFAITCPPDHNWSFLNVRRIAPLPGGLSIDVGDITGDGLSDFAIAVPGGVQLMSEQACRDSDCKPLSVQP